MRRLAALGILEHVDLFTCVSGGSIAGATVIKHWADPARLDILDRYLRTPIYRRVVGDRRRVSTHFEDRLDKLAASYDRDLFDGATLDGLGGGPRLYVNATNLATGNLFFFVTGGGKPAEMGEHELGVVAAPGFRCAGRWRRRRRFRRCFRCCAWMPAAMRTPAAWSTSRSPTAACTTTWASTPGARTRNALDYVIVSDGGKPLPGRAPTESGAIVLKAALDIMMEQIPAWSLTGCKHRHAALKGPQPLWFSIDSREGEAQAGDAAFASIKTNLTRLGREEMDVLTRHGGALVEASHPPLRAELIGA